MADRHRYISTDRFIIDVWKDGFSIHDHLLDSEILGETKHNEDWTPKLNVRVFSPRGLVKEVTVGEKRRLKKVI